MFDKIIHHSQIAWYYIWLSILKQFEYPLYLVSWCLLIPLQYISGVCILSALTYRFHDIAGWIFPELMFLYGIALLSHAMFIILFIPTWNTEFMIVNGQFDRQLVRPLNVFFQYSVQSVEFVGLIDLLPAVIILWRAKELLHIPNTLYFYLSLLIIVIGATLIRTSIYIVLGAVAFWTVRSKALVMNGFILLDRVTMYPQNMYPYILQMFFTYILPIGFIAFFPAETLLGKTHEYSTPFEIPLMTLCIGLLMFFCAQLCFKIGLARYGSTGS